MIEKEDKEFYLQCDYCPNVEGPFDSFADAVLHKKVNKWKSVKLGEEWVDKCPTCKPVQIGQSNKTQRKIKVNFGGM